MKIVHRVALCLTLLCGVAGCVSKHELTACSGPYTSLASPAPMPEPLGSALRQLSPPVSQQTPEGPR